MDLGSWDRLVASGVTPVVALSACGFLTIALYNRLTTVVTRARTFLRERLSQRNVLTELLGESPDDAVAISRQKQLLAQLELQTKRVISRAREIRRALFCLHTAISSFVGCALLKALEVFLPMAVVPSGVLFVSGLSFVLGASLFALAELRHALDPVELESRFIDEWIGKLEDE